jgi:hypothetical protein
VEVVRNGVLQKFDIELVNAPGGFREISRLQPVQLHTISLASAGSPPSTSGVPL